MDKDILKKLRFKHMHVKPMKDRYLEIKPGSHGTDTGLIKVNSLYFAF